MMVIRAWNKAFDVTQGPEPNGSRRSNARGGVDADNVWGEASRTPDSVMLVARSRSDHPTNA